MKRSILRKLILLLLALGLLVLGGVDYWYRNVREIPFDQQAWISTPALSDNSDVRLRMYEDLKARYLVIGMQQSRVRELLGEPDIEEAGFLGYAIAGHGLLRLSFDSDGRLTHYGLGDP